MWTFVFGSLFAQQRVRLYIRSKHAHTDGRHRHVSSTHGALIGPVRASEIHFNESDPGENKIVSFLDGDK